MSAENARVPKTGLAVVVFNEAAGFSSPAKKERLLQQAGDRLRLRGMDVSVKRTKYPGHEADLAAQSVSEGADIVFAGGGEGTASNMLPALEGQNTTALGILPFGTINIIAREFGIPVFSPDAIDVQMDGDIRQMDVGVMNDRRWFRAVAGIGFDGSTMHAINTVRTRKGGRFASIAPAYFATCGLMYPFAQPTEADITVDGDTQRTSLFEAWTGNTTLLAYMRLREGYVNDGQGELTVFPKLGPVDFVTSALPALWRHIRSLPTEQVPTAKYFRGSNITIETQKPRRAVADGEEVSDKPINSFNIDIRQNAIPTVVPRTQAAHSLFV